MITVGSVKTETIVEIANYLKNKEHLKERNEVSKTMKPDRFTIRTNQLDFMKLNEKIYTYELENGYNPYLFMNSDTIDGLTNIVGFHDDGLMGFTPNGYCGTYCGRKTFCDETMQFGEVEMR